MSQSHIQTGFHAGEFAPSLNAKVDLQKYHSGAARLKNFYVDYHGGVSTRAGTKYIIQAYKSDHNVRLIPFAASFSVSYVLEFGDQYIRFHYQGSPVLETGINITGITKANPCVVTVANSYSVGDWVYISGVSGMTEINGRYFEVSAATAGTITLADLNGNPIDSTGYTTYVSGGTAARIYTLASPYYADDLADLKFAQDVNTLILCNPNYDPHLLTLNTPTNWTISEITFGPTISTPTSVTVTTTLSGGSANYAYVVTAVDANGQESGASSYGTLASKQDLRNVAGTNTVTWTAVAGATSYNVYKSQVTYGTSVPLGSQFGYIGNVTSNTLVDSNISPDYGTTPPVIQNPFQGSGVSYVTVTTSGTYTSVPTVTFSAAPSGGQTAAGSVSLWVTSYVIAFGGINYAVGDTLTFSNGLILVVATVGGGAGGSQITSFRPLTDQLTSRGNVTSGTPPTTMTVVSTSGSGILCQLSSVTWGVGNVSILYAGAGYETAPTITFSSGAAAATATLSESTAGIPTVPGYFDQRLFLGSLANGPSTFYMSIPNVPFNFNTNNPVQSDGAISARLKSQQLNTIKSVVPMPSGLIVLCDRQAFLLNGGSAGTAVSATSIVANAQAYNGASDVPPIISNYDILYVQAKGSIVRDLSYNFYANVFTGTDITILSSHLFFGYVMNEWAYCEEPFKTIWVVRNDGVLLCLTYLKEQELVGWTHCDTDGLFKSVATVTESTDYGSVDALYMVVEREVNGNTVKYIERMADRFLVNGLDDAWCVDAGISYSGTATTTFSGAEHLAGMTVTGLADGAVITPFVMPDDGLFTLPTAASNVVIGLGYTCQLQTLQLDLGEPTVQGKRKHISAVTVRVCDTLGLTIGSTFNNQVVMKDLRVGNVGTMTNTVVDGLVTGDARTILDPTYNVQGQYCIQQALPYPATILGVIPEITIGDRDPQR